MEDKRIKKYPFGMSAKLYRLNVGMALALLVIAALTTTVLWIRALDIASAQDAMSNQSAGGFSTHRISFNLSGGNSFSAGEFIIFDFPAEFTSGDIWLQNDFSFVDSAARDVVAVNAGAGATTVTCAQDGNNIGIAVDITANIFRIIPCSEGGTPFTASTPGAPISFTINGANPFGTLANPIVAGTYVITILDAAGDCDGGCSIAVSIVDSSNVSVAASVPGECGNGIVEWGEQCDDGNEVSFDGCSSACRIEGSTPPPTDRTPPTIDYHCAINIRETAATISWETNEFADSLVRCGTTSGVYPILRTETSFIQEHRIELTELDPATVYFCQVCSKDSAQNNACSAECSFATLDERPPVISDIHCTDATETSFIVRWTTNEISNSGVDYGLVAGPPYDRVVNDPTLMVDHAVTLSGLTRATLYHYRVRSNDAAGNGALSLDATCSTSGGESPTISDIRATDIGCYSAMIRWSTNVGTDSTVDFGQTAGPPYDRSVSDPGITLEHALRLIDLLPGTVYNYRSRARDVIGQETVTPNQTFTTASLGELLISDVGAADITANSVRITWNTNRQSDSAADYGPVGYENTVSNPALAYTHSLNVSGLLACTEYLFRVRSVDLCGGSRTSAGHHFTTGPQVAPTISNVRVSAIDENSARIFWDTTTPTNSVVDYGTTIAYGRTASDATLNSNHLMILNGLRPGATYHFRVRSADPCRQEAVSEDVVFTTLPDNEPPGCTTDLIATAGDARVSLLWRNPPDVDYSGTVVVRRVGRCPVGPADGTVVFDGVGITYENSGLVNGLTYCYGAFPYDDARNFGCGVTASATPIGARDTTPPVCPSNFGATSGDREVLLHWDNPADADFAGVRIQRGPSESCPVSEREGSTIYEGQGDNWVDATVTNEVTYCYSIFSFDNSLNFCSGVSAEARPFAPVDHAPPACAHSASIIPGDGQLLVTWENPADGDWTGTLVVRRDDRFPVGPADGVVIFDGVGDQVLDGGLNNNQTYYYGLFSHDEVPNYCLGVTAQGTPIAGAPPPVSSCTDTDGGLNFFSQGTVILSEELQYIDACLDRDVLQENYCFAGDLATIDYRCGVGYRCSAGRCVPDVHEPPIQQCGNGICEQPDCDIDCGEMTYDLYIINPDGTERHTFTEYVRVTELEPNLEIIGFEDKGEDWDYNDVEFRLDTRNCGRIAVTLISHDAAWNHQVRLLVNYRGVPKLDRLVWQDSRVNVGDSTYLNVTDDPAICSGMENSVNCPGDCPVIIPTEPTTEEITVSPDEHISPQFLNFYATKGRLPLVVNDDTVDVYPTMSVITVLPVERIEKQVRAVYFRFEEMTYVMLPTAAGYEAKSIMPEELGLEPFAVIIEYGDATVDVINGYFQVIPFPRVFGKVEDLITGIGGARVTLLVESEQGNYGLWNGEPFGQGNPMLSRENGAYGFIVPPGKYRLIAEKDGYRTKETLPFLVKNNLIASSLQLIALPEEDFLGMILGPQLLQGLETYLKYGVEAGSEDFGEFINNPFVEERTKNVVAPTVIAVAAVNVLVAGAASATAIPYLLYLYSFLVHPSLLFAGRRKKWGVVFNSITKQPVDLAIVRLLDNQTDRIIRSMVTDKNGRYFFMVNQGSYRIIVAKNGFIFPTVYLKDEIEDVRYADLYHGEAITVSESTSITANIPIDPLFKEKTPRRVVWEGIMRRFQRNISWITIAAMAVAVVISPSPFVIILFAMNLAIYLLFRRLAKGRRPKSWGIVYDERTRRPLRNAVVRVFEARYNKLLETRVTDIRGRYAFLVGNNVYYVTYEKPGYQKKQTGPLDLIDVKKEEEQLIAEDVGLFTEDAVGLWRSLRRKVRSTFVTFGPERASIGEEPLVNKIGKTGRLIVGSNNKSASIPRFELAVAEGQIQSATKVKESPWELQVLQKQRLAKEESVIKKDSERSSNIDNEIVEDKQENNEEEKK